MKKDLLDLHTLAWLTSVGYEVRGRSRDDLLVFFQHEARQWGLSPRELARMIREDYNMLHACMAGQLD